MNGTANLPRHTRAPLDTLAHELRSPLGSILSSVDVMRLVPGDAALIARARATIERQALHMKWLIDDLLQPGGTGPRLVHAREMRLDLGRVLEEAVDAIRSRPEGAGRRLALTPPRDPILVAADRGPMTQVFDNLLTNACKYTDAGGRVGVSLERSGSQAVVRIADDGIGIAGDMLLEVFEPYVQVDGGGPRARGGIGIGLALAKELVEGHGGTITAESAGLGQGSTFVVRLPARRAPR